VNVAPRDLSTALVPRKGVFVLGALLPVLAGVVGCGAGTPLMHPAHVLEAGQVRVAAGASHYVALGDAEVSIDESRTLGDEPNAIPDDEREAFVKGATAEAIGTPGLAAFASARAGLGNQNEMGLTYSGRRVRGDLRHAFLLDDLALSVGGGIGGILPNISSSSPRTGSGAPNEPDGEEIGRFDGGSVSGWTIDVPILLGARTRPDVVSGWVGGHVLYERFNADFVFDFDSDEPLTAAPADGSRFFAGAVAGMSVGMKPLRIVLEVSGGYQSLDADVRTDTVTFGPHVAGLVIVPSFALSVDVGQ
jgi:hypothetical protein